MSANDVFDEDDIPAFLKNNGQDPNKIIDDLESEDDFDFPSLDDDDTADLGLPEEEETIAEMTRHAEASASEPETPKPEKPRKETKADKQAKLVKQQPAAEPKPEEPENKRARAGDNSGIQADELRSFIERIERLEEDKAEIASDIKDVKAEAKGSGYDGKTLAAILKLRKKDKAERDEEEALLHLYMFALGME